MNKSPVCIENSNLSLAWAEAFGDLMQPGLAEVSTLVVTITGFDNGYPHEVPEIRGILDQALRDRGEPDCHTVANTLFPVSLWNPSRGREVLFQRFAQTWPRVRLHRGNRYGTYSHRLIAFGSAKKPFNQLDHIIQTYRGGNHRRSALQASIFDPTRDHTDQRQRGFPCLQHVFFAPDEDTQQLTVTGIYAKQHIFEKAYGNYLGLCRLGNFMAHEMELKLGQMVCISNIASLGNYGKSDLGKLAESLPQIASRPNTF